MIPPKTRPEWRELLTGNEQHSLKFLALKLVMTRLRLRISADASPASVESCIDELHYFAVENEKFVWPDLKEVFQ